MRPAAWLLLVYATVSYAVVKHVTCCKLGDVLTEINNANSGDIIELETGTYTGSTGCPLLTDGNALSKSLTINGTATTLDCGGKNFVSVTGGTAAGVTHTLLGLTFIKGNNVIGAVAVRGCSALVIRDCVFRGNNNSLVSFTQTGTSGGALSLLRVVMTGNTMAGSGAAVVVSGGNVSVVSSTIDGVVGSPAYSHMLVTNARNVSLVASSFLNGTGTSGAILVNGTSFSLAVTGCTFANHTGGDTLTGKSTLAGSSLSITSSTFSQGGSVSIDLPSAKSLAVTQTSFTRNTGPALEFVDQSPTSLIGGATITGCFFTSNTNSGGTGGGLYVGLRSFGAFIFRDNVFTSNNATNGGGAAFWSNFNLLLAPLTFNNLTFTRNAATANGAALYMAGNFDAISACIFSSNSAPLSVVHIASDVAATGVTFTGNYATTTILSTGDGLTLVASNISAQRGPSASGVFFSGASISISSSLFQDNAIGVGVAQNVLVFSSSFVNNSGLLFSNVAYDMQSVAITNTLISGCNGAGIGGFQLSMSSLKSFNITDVVITGNLFSTNTFRITQGDEDTTFPATLSITRLTLTANRISGAYLWAQNLRENYALVACDILATGNSLKSLIKSDMDGIDVTLGRVNFTRNNGGLLYYFGTASRNVLLYSIAASHNVNTSMIVDIANVGAAGLFTATDSTFLNNTAPVVMALSTCATVDAVLRRCTFEQNSGRAVSAGGLTGGGTHNLDIECCGFVENRGGCIKISNGAAEFSITDSWFVRNTVHNSNTSVDAGVIYSVNQNCIPNVTNSTFVGNSAAYGAGVLYGVRTVAGDFASFENCMFINNGLLAQNDYGQGAGAIFVSVVSPDPNPLKSLASPIVFRNCIISNNTGPTGAMFVNNRWLWLDGTVLESNVGTFGGGALTLLTLTGTSASARANITNSTFRENRAAAGGAIYSQAAIYMDTVVVENNAAIFDSDIGGGGAVCTMGSLAATNSTFRGNLAATRGGGAVYSSDVVTLTNCNVFDNNAPGGPGGGVVALRLTSATTAWTGNSANAGGAINVGTSGIIMIDGDTFSDNSATQNGGAIYASFTNLFTVRNTNINHNVALGNANGGGIYCLSCTVSLDRSVTIQYNNASRGGGFFCAGGHLITNATFHGNYASTGALPDASPEADCGSCGCCPAPPQITYPNNDCVLMPGQPCIYSCPAGYNNQSTTLTCPAQNTQIKFNDLCSAATCSLLGVTNGGVAYYNLTNEVVQIPTQQDTAKYCCNEGYLPANSADSVSTCGASGWDPAPGYRCAPRTCTFTAPKVGTILPSLAGVTGDVVTLNCPPGYRVEGGSNTSVCWGVANPLNPGLPCNDSHYLPSQNSRCFDWCPIGECIAQPCQLPAVDGVISFTPLNIKTGQTTTVSCAAGREPSTPYQVTCMGDGVFSPPIQPCNIPPCDALPTLPNAAILYSNGNRTATYQCAPGFTLNGAATRTCGSNNLWAGVAPQCDAITCAITNTNLDTDCDGVVAYGDVCYVQCSLGKAGPVAALLCAPLTASTAALNQSDASILCTDCGGATFGPPGAPFCVPCINGRAPNLASDRTACLCYTGFYAAPVGSGNCSACVDGAICHGDGAQPVSKPGYFKTDDPLVFIQCSPAAACGGDNACATGYTGYLCGTCIDGYYRRSGLCYPCPNDSGALIAVFVVVGLLACLALVFIAQPSEIGDRTYGLTSVTIGLNFLQMIAAFLNTNLTWTATIRRLLNVFTALNLNLELVSPECSFKMTFYTKLQAQLLAPLVVAVVMVVVWAGMCLVTWVRAGRPTCKTFKSNALHHFKSCCAGFFLFMTVAYLVLAIASMSLFSCKKQSVGNFDVISSSPSDKCYSDEWNSNAILAIFGIILYVVGTPVAILSVFARLRMKFGSGAAGEDVLVHFFVNKYRKQAWHFEVAVTIRKLLIVIIAIFLGDQPFLQAIVCVFVFLLACVVNLLYKPYRWYWHNIADNVCLIACLIVLFCGMASTSTILSTTQVNIADSLAVLCVVLVLVLLALVFGLEIYVLARIIADTRRKAAARPNGGKDGASTEVRVGDTPVTALLAVPGTHDVWCGSNSVDHPIKVVNALSHSSEDVSLARVRHMTVLPRAGLIAAADATCVYLLLPSSRGSSSPVVATAFPSLQSAEASIAGVAVSERGVLAVALHSGHLEFYTVEGGVASLGVSTTSSAVDPGVPLAGSLSGAGLSQTFTEEDRLIAMQMAALDDDEFDPNNSNRRSLMRPASVYTPPAAAVGGEVRMTSMRVIANAHEAGLAAVAAGGTFFYTADHTTIKRWSPKHEAPLHEWTLPLPSGVHVTTIHVVADQVFAGSTSGIIYAVDTQLNSFRTLSGHTGPVRALSSSADSRMLISGGHDGVMRIWDASLGQLLQRMPSISGPITSVALVGNVLACGTESGALHLAKYDSADGHRSPEVILENVYRRCPCLRPRSAKSTTTVASHKNLSNSEQVGLLMEDFSFNELPEEEAHDMLLALSASRPDDDRTRLL